MENIAPAEFEAVVALLADPRRHIHFTGGRFTGALARYAESHFRIVRSDVDFIEGQPALWRDRMIEIGRKDVIVAFDIRRYQEDVIAAVRNGGEAGRDGGSAHRSVALAHRPRGAPRAAGPYRRLRRTGIPPPAFCC